MYCSKSCRPTRLFHSSVLGQWRLLAIRLSSAVKRQVADMMSMCKSGNCAGLQQALQDLANQLGDGDGDDQDGDGQGFGKGGIDRGRGDAPMVFGAERELTDAFYAGVPLAEGHGSHQTFYSNAKAKQLLGFQPQHSWRDYLNDPRTA